MTFDHELVLIGAKYGKNKIGDSVLIPTRRTILCDVQSVTRSEHYQAAAYGLSPEIVFVVHKYDYEGEKQVELEGKVYNVTRTYIPRRSKDISDFETLELICEGVVNRAHA